MNLREGKLLGWLLDPEKAPTDASLEGTVVGDLLSAGGKHHDAGSREVADAGKAIAAGKTTSEAPVAKAEGKVPVRS